MEYDFAPMLEGAGAGELGSEADVFQGLVISQGFFGMPDVEGSAKPSIIIKTPSGNDSGVDNPLNLISTIGWKNLFTVKRLDEVRGVRIETGSSF